MRELAVLAVNDTYSSAQKTAMSTEYVALSSQIDQIAANTQFNGIKVINGDGGGATATSVFTFQVGANNSQTMTVSIAQQSLSTYVLSATTIATAATAAAQITLIDTAIGTLNTQRSSIGAAISRLTHAVDNLSNVAQNATESRSKITDTDYAQATSDLARQQIIQQAGTAMLAQANQMPSMVLALLR
jgi:flagellin